MNPSPAIDPFLEAQYNNRARVPGHPAIVAGWGRDAAAYRDAVGDRRARIAYGEGPRLTLDLFAPEHDRTPDRAVLFVHGGYWQGLDPGFFSHLARGLNARGHLVALVGYDLCPAVGLSVIVDEVRAAAGLLARRGRKLVAAGHSAGGHLAACLLATGAEPGVGAAHGAEPGVGAAYAISGLFELWPLVPTSINAALGLDEAEARRLSPRLWPAPAGRAFDAVVGGAESEEFHRQSRAIAEAWGAAGVATRCEAIGAADHFTVVAGLAEPDDPMTARVAALLAGLA